MASSASITPKHFEVEYHFDESSLIHLTSWLHLKIYDYSYPENNQAGSNQETTDYLVRKVPRVVVDIPSVKMEHVGQGSKQLDLVEHIPAYGRESGLHDL